MATTHDTSFGAVPLDAKRHIDAPAVVARLNYIETALFGSPLVVQPVEPPAREHKCVEPMPTLLDPDIPEAAGFATGTLAELIGHESERLAFLRRIERLTHAMCSDPALLTDESRRDLHEAFELLYEEYCVGGTTETTNRLGDIAAEAAEKIGLLSGDRIPQSDGGTYYTSEGFAGNYLVHAPEDIAKSIETYTCEKCLPNFMAMIEHDKARGLLKATASA